MKTREQQRKIMHALRVTGASDAYIAALFGLSRERVGQVLGRARASIRPRIVAESTITLDQQLPARLLAWRTRRRLSQAQAARFLGVSPHSWMAWESHRRTCGLPGVLTRLLNANDALDQIERNLP